MLRQMSSLVKSTIFLRDFYQQEVVSDEKEVKEKQSNIQFTKGKENKDVK